MRRLGQAGFSLLEVMISMAVLAFVLLAFMSIMTSAASLSTSTREGLLASYELQSALEDTLGIAYSDFLASYPPQDIFVNPPTPNAQGFYADPGGKLNKYWSLSSAQPGVLQQEAVGIKILNTVGSTTSYQIEIMWKTHKGFIQRDLIFMQRSAR